MPKCSNVTFKIQTAATKTINNKIHCDVESFSDFLISQYFYGSASSVDFFCITYEERLPSCAEKTTCKCK